MSTPILLPDDIDDLIVPPLPVRNRIGIGCIGAGFIMRDCHLPAYRQHGLNVVGITSRTRKTAEEVASLRQIPHVFDSATDLARCPEVEVIDIAVPPDVQKRVIEEVLNSGGEIRGLLAQKPLGQNLEEAREIVRMCDEANLVLAVNQNMRFDHSVRLMKWLLDRNELGDPILATLDMRAVPHWMPWQKRLGWLTLRIMSIHHLDTFRYWFGDPERIFCSTRTDPRTEFDHEDGIVASTLEYESGLRVVSTEDVWTGPAPEPVPDQIGIRYRIEGTRGIAMGTIGWPSYPERTPSTLRYATETTSHRWVEPTWEHVWFPDAFIGPMADLLTALEEHRPPTISGRDNLRTMALVEAAYESSRFHRAIEPPTDL